MYDYSLSGFLLPEGVIFKVAKYYTKVFWPTVKKSNFWIYRKYIRRGPQIT